MSTKTYTVRVPTGTPDTTSDHVSQWLESHLASPTDLASDPGAGEHLLRLSLDREKVAQGAHSADEPEATFLRRLIATNVVMPQEEQEESKTQARPRAPVLKGALKLRPDQIRPVVRGLEATGWNPAGSWCQNCAQGRQKYDTVGVRNPAMQNHHDALPAAIDQHEMPVPDLPPARPSVVSRAQGDNRTPATTARALKAALYVIVIAVTWAFVHFFGDGAKPSDDDVLELEPDSPGPTPSDDYSTWEPEV
jgi:hypothetical protein